MAPTPAHRRTTHYVFHAFTSSFFLSGFPNPPSYAAVRRSWQGLQEDAQLLRSQNSPLSPLWGTTWSTVVATVTRGGVCCSQYTHSGCSRRNAARAFCHARV